MKKNIPISKPYFDSRDLNSVRKPLASGWVSQGKFVEKFQEKFRKITGSRYAIAVSSCTSALHIAMRTLGIKEGDDVILPAFTWISTANAIEECGARPVFCDIDIDTYNIDCEKVESLITKRTKALMPVHLFGLCSDMDKIVKIAGNHKLRITEDCACSFYSFYKGKHSGNFGDIGCFSFHPRKSITTGEGGMIVTGKKEFFEKAKSLRNIGSSIKPAEFPFLLPEFDELGYNYRMTDIQGALGSSQLDKAKKIIDYKLRLAKNYDKLFRKLDYVRIPFRHKDYFHSYQSYVILYNPDNMSIDELIKKDRWKEYYNIRNKIMRALMQKGIHTRPGTHSAAHTEYYSRKYDIKPEDFPASFVADKLTIALPFFYGMTKQDQNYVFKNILHYHRIFIKS